MARLWSSGFELNSTTSNVEFGTAQHTSETAIIRSGTYSGKFLKAEGSTGVLLTEKQYRASATAEDIYVRIYVKIVKIPDTTPAIIFNIYDGGTSSVSVRLTATGGLQLYNSEDSAQVGSDSSNLSLNTWYRLELRVNSTTIASTQVEALIDGTSFASSTIDMAASKSFFRWGEITSSDDYEIYYEDIAINDSTGSFQNSYPGQGKIIHLRPNAAGDNTAWTGDYTDVDEVTPDNTTTKLSSNTLDQIEDMNIDSPTMMGDQDTVNVVAVGVRFNGVGASANASFVLRIKASASGTVEESSAITPSNTTYVTNAAASPRNYSLVLYDLPGASTTAWTKNDLEQAQIGVRLSATSTNAAQVSTIWASVDYVPVFGPMKPKPRNPKINWRI